jgi:hypothetical protein
MNLTTVSLDSRLLRAPCALCVFISQTDKTIPLKILQITFSVIAFLPPFVLGVGILGRCVVAPAFACAPLVLNRWRFTCL